MLNVMSLGDRMKVWKIEGYHGTTKIYERELQIGYFSEKQIQDVLKALAAKAGLGFDEIIGAYARRRTKGANDLLSVQREGLYPKFSCGENPYFTARIVDAES